MMKNFTLFAVAGPTTDQQPAFNWTASGFDSVASHFGHPEVWNFTSFTPTWML
jgi:hypothetical protein